MKTIKRFKPLMITLVIGVFLSACSQNKTHKSAEEMTHDHSQMEMPEPKEMTPMTASVSKEQAQSILSAYLIVKEALVKTDGEAASAAAKTLLDALGDSQGEMIDKIRFDAEHINGTKDADHQRDHFNTLSDNVYEIVKSTSANEATLYRQFCPMALDNKGAYWLSYEKEIMNPYFGDKMLKCGAVKEEI
ncbi:MAG: DUF3347 domain-containing protein [Reichenbachiella sp.]